MRYLTILVALFLVSSFGLKAQKAEHLDAKTFKKLVYNYDKNTKWQYEGKLPAIVDFYTDWCGPCRYVAPFLEELSKEYDGKIKVYKVNTEKNPEVARAFKIRGIPTFLFITADGKMKKRVGAMPKSGFEHEINNYMKVKK